jgi:exonuclease VII small subunit
LQSTEEGPGRVELQKSVDSQQADWMQLVSTVEGERERLETMLREWVKAEQVMEEINSRLRDMRQTLSTDVNNSYEALQLELLRCKVRVVSDFVFVNGQ